MSDLPPLGLPRRPGSPPRPEVLQAVVAQGRRRIRAAALSGTGALVALVGAVAGTALLGAGPGDALVVVPASPLPGLHASIGPEPAPEPMRPTASGGASLGGVGQPQPQPAGRPTPVGPTAEAAAPRPAAPPLTAARGRPLPAFREQPRESGYADLCTGEPLAEAPEGYRVCVEASAARTTRQGEPVDVQIRLCNSLSSPGPLRLAFSSGQEHEVQVRPADAAYDWLWTWSHHVRFVEGAHERWLGRGMCLDWTTTWAGRDDAGGQVPVGDYVVELSVDINGRTRSVSKSIEVLAKE